MLLEDVMPLEEGWIFEKAMYPSPGGCNGYIVLFLRWKELNQQVAMTRGAGLAWRHQFGISWLVDGERSIAAGKDFEVQKIKKPLMLGSARFSQVSSLSG